jgi:hypothetical protein
MEKIRGERKQRAEDALKAFYASRNAVIEGRKAALSEEEAPKNSDETGEFSWTKVKNYLNEAAARAAPRAVEVVNTKLKL